ncbi:1-phosphofructokinase family hexose kinase [Paenibacillus sp. D2_2]|uniref:1-phosphofructokinase family hexose kinase n=1 Tax=Paenibacillus sp. D2_2 TaxID=3073092 RepID=UPI002815A1CE|nr:1-phosphofructokinase family hexose kinase [Paenibacillus sp. D2_2]WMT41395.1 1-phosphofructokinase family hexose kinase [Paenibacillus sp. D2_2]
MITTVTLNAAIDKTYYVHSFISGEVHRVARQVAEPGGKGNNVAKVIRLLGGKVTASGFIAGNNGTFIEAGLQARGIDTAFIAANGESRVCLNIMDESSGLSTELLEQGPAVGRSQIAQLKQNLLGLARDSSIVVLSGSLPPGAPAELYAELISIVKTAGARAYLDTSGIAFSAGIEAKPHFVKPNEHELAVWLGKVSLTENESIEAAHKLSDEGISQVCVTLGERGTIAVIDGQGFRVNLPMIQAVNTVGCGDSFVAGMAYSESRGDSPAERLRIATAAAAANAMSERAGHIEDDVFQRFLHQVKVVPL